MQIKRPVCLAAVIYLLFNLLLVYGAGYGKQKLSVENKQSVFVTGTVLAKQEKTVFWKKALIVTIQEPETKRRILCYMKDGEPYLGQQVRLKGTVALFDSPSNPGEFDSQAYYQILHISYKLQNAVVIAASETYSKPQEKIYRLKLNIGHQIDSLYGEDYAPLIRAVLLGDKADLGTDIRKLYQMSGIIHILAISGLHISLLGVGLYSALKKMYLPNGICTCISLTFMVGYGTLAGMGTSVLRAIVMFSLHLMAKQLGRTYDMLTAASIIGIWMLLEQPLYVKHSGFLLSFGAVVALGYFLPWYRELWGEWKKDHPLKKAFVSGSCISLITLPVLLYFYYAYPLYAMILNLYVIPLMTLLMCSSLFAVLLNMAAGTALLQNPLWMSEGIWQWLSIGIEKTESGLVHAAVEIGKGILRVYERSCVSFLGLPGASLVLGQPAAWKIPVYYGVLSLLALYGLYRGETRKKAEYEHGIPSACTIFILLIMLLFLCKKDTSGMQLHFVDVGQGDCIVCRMPGGDCFLFDAGSTSKKKVGEYTILPFLKSQGIGRLDAVFLSHPDEDHIGGVLEILEDYELSGIQIGAIVLSDVDREIKEKEFDYLLLLAAKNGIPVRYVSAGDVLQRERFGVKVRKEMERIWGGKPETSGGDYIWRITCLGPEKGAGPQDINEISETFLLQYGSFSACLTGDVTGEAEKNMLYNLQEILGENASKKNSSSGLTLLKVAHHGSKFTSSKEFLEYTAPRLAIISAGTDNSYGHPHAETLERLDAVQARYLCTKDTGWIGVSVQSGGKRCLTHVYNTYNIKEK